MWFDYKRVRLRDVVSEAECEQLVRRCSDLWRALGFPEYAWWTAEWEHIASDTFGSHYTALWLDKFDFDPVSWTEEWESAMREIRDDQGTEVLGCGIFVSEKRELMLQQRMLQFGYDRHVFLLIDKE